MVLQSEGFSCKRTKFHTLAASNSRNRQTSWLYYYLLMPHIRVLLLQPIHWRCMCDSPRLGCAQRITPIYMCHEQAIIQWSRRVISIVACCHGVKLCTLAAQAFRSQKMVLWPGCEGRARCSLHKKNVRSVRFVVKRRGCCCNLSIGVALNVRFTTKRMCAKNNIRKFVARTSNNRVIATHYLYCYLLPQSEALRTCRSSSRMATTSCTKVTSKIACGLCSALPFSVFFSYPVRPSPSDLVRDTVGNELHVRRVGDLHMREGLLLHAELHHLYYDVPL